MNVVKLKVAAVITNSEGDTLLIQEQYENGEGFKWNLVKGTYDNFDETIEDCMRREIREETCLEISTVSLVRIYHYGDSVNARILFLFNAYCPNDSISIPIQCIRNSVQGEHIIRAQWFTKQELKNMPDDKFMASYVVKSLFPRKEIKLTISIERL